MLLLKTLDAAKIILSLLINKRHYFKIISKNIYKKRRKGTSLVVQWLRIHLECRGHGFDPWSGN